MASMKANPLGELKMEIVSNGVTESGGYSLDSAPSFRSQVPVKDGLAGQETFKVDAKKPTSRAEVEKRRMHIDSGADLRGASMNKEFGKGDGSADDFTSTKTD
jgi:hypothetical protein